MNFVVLCLILVSSCLAEENQTVTVDAPSSIQKREKQHLIVEDDDCDGSSVKRDERESSPSRINISENDVKVLQNSLNAKLKPKIIPVVPIKPVVKPKVAAKPVRVDTTPKRIPPKIPVVLKQKKVLPTPAQQALRLKIIEGLKNESSLRQDAETNKDSKIFNIENKNGKIDAQNPKQDTQQTVKPENTITPDISVHEDHPHVDLGTEGHTIDHEHEIISASVDEPNSRRVDTASEKPVKARPVLFYEDEADTTPLLVKKRPKPEKPKETQSKVKEMPITRNSGAKVAEETKFVDDDDPEAVHITNGTHLISIKKLRDDKHTSDCGQHTERRDSETPVADKHETKLCPKENHVVPLVPPDVRKRVDPTNPHGHEKTPKIHGRDPNDSIMISNHDYEEVEERTMLAPPAQVTTPVAINPYNKVPQDSWNYLQNLYYNPYYPNVYNQYRRYYEEQDPQIYKDTNEYLQNYQNPNPENRQNIPYDEDVVYNDFPTRNNQPTDTCCPDKPQENILDRIWRTWKDVEIKIKNNNEDPVDVDVRRNILLDNLHNDVSNIPSYVTQPIGLNGYYNNQNSPLLYPYCSPTYRYLH